MPRPGLGIFLQTFLNGRVICVISNILCTLVCAVVMAVWFPPHPFPVVCVGGRHKLTWAIVHPREISPQFPHGRAAPARLGTSSAQGPHTAPIDRWTPADDSSWAYFGLYSEKNMDRKATKHNLFSLPFDTSICIHNAVETAGGKSYREQILFLKWKREWQLMEGPSLAFYVVCCYYYYKVVIRSDRNFHHYSDLIRNNGWWYFQGETTASCCRHLMEQGRSSLDQNKFGKNISS
jgi:hypothetical protein